MSELQTATDIIAIIYMGLMALITFAVIIGAVVVWQKVSRVKQKVEGKVNLVKNMPSIAREVFKAALKAMRQT